MLGKFTFLSSPFHVSYVPFRAPFHVPVLVPCRGAPMTGGGCCDDEIYSCIIDKNVLVDKFEQF